MEIQHLAKAGTHLRRSAIALAAGTLLALGSGAASALETTFTGTAAGCFGLNCVPATTTSNGTFGGLTYLNSSFNVTTAGGFVSEQLAFNDRLFVTGTLRADKNSAFGKNFGLVRYPALSASYVVVEGGDRLSQRLGIAVALLGDPHVMMFDEPVNGLDPEGVFWIRNLLKALAAEGRTVFLSSHLMSEMAITADRLIIIGRGRLITETTMVDGKMAMKPKTATARNSRANTTSWVTCAPVIAHSPRRRGG